MGSGTGIPSEEHIVTDPYCPLVWETPLYNFPLIFKGSDKFPAVGEDWVMGHTTRTVTRRGWRCPITLHVETAEGVPKLGERHCQMRTQWLPKLWVQMFTHENPVRLQRDRGS